MFFYILALKLMVMIFIYFNNQGNKFIIMFNAKKRRKLHLPELSIRNCFLKHYKNKIKSTFKNHFIHRINPHLNIYNNQIEMIKYMMATSQLSNHSTVIYQIAVNFQIEIHTQHGLINQTYLKF